MDQQSSNANMPRDTVETLKQIQKQGLSISIVNKSNSGSFSLPSPASAEIRPKQSVVTSEKTAKIAPMTPRSQTVTENKSQILQARLATAAETRVTPGRVISQTAFLDNKAISNQARSNQIAVSDSKGFSPSWNSPNSSADKSQGTTSRPVVTTPVSKMQTSQVRAILPDNKTPVSRNNQSIVTESKNQARATPGQRISQSQQLIEGKTQTNQERVNVNPASPPDTKVFSNQARTGQQFVVSQDNKTIPVQRVAPQKSGDIKSANQLTANKQDIKTSQANRIVHNVKGISDVSQSKIRQNYPVKADGKANIGSSPMIVENKMVNSVRMVKNTVDGNSLRTTTQCKSSQMRLPPSASGGETVQTVQTKTIFSTVKICYKSVAPESKMVLQGTKVTTQASEMFQKTATVFGDVAAEASPSGSVPTRVITPKRGAVFPSSPQKKKCLKRPATATAETSGKNINESNLNSAEEGNGAFFNNLKTNRTGLTITPVHLSTPIPSTTGNAVNVVKMPGEVVDKEAYRLALEKAHKSQRGKSRGRGGRRKYVEPVCLTLSSDDEEEHMQAQFNNFEEAFAHQAILTQDSGDGSKSGQSSPVYQDENDPECDLEDPEFPGVTNIPCPRTPEDNYPGSEEDEDEDEEREMDEMEEEEAESIGEEEEEELEEEEMDEDEEVPPEEEEEEDSYCKDKNALVDPPLRCRSVRIGSYKVHPRSAGSSVFIYLNADGISFTAPMVTDPNKIVNITIKSSDVIQLLIHFGKCLPIVFIQTSPSFGEILRKSLNMSSPDSVSGYYDPTSSDERAKKITFLIDCIAEDQRNFFRYKFVQETKVTEVDQKTANEILVKSTPNNNNNRSQSSPNFVCLAQPQPQPQPQVQPVAQPSPQSQPHQQLQHIQISPENLISVTAIPKPVPVKPGPPAPPAPPAVRLFTYPPPPQTGGIPITNEDLACLHEGEFLNDAIIDFYLKYIYNEKLSEYNREKTHIFSSYFFQRLTHKPERARQEELPKNIQMRRHSQVKTWTRNFDIFSKDFIIIPVNQNVHWFLAIVCYPGLVPEASESPVRLESKINKSSDNVSSTDDQDESKPSKEANSSVDGNNPNSDENSTASSSSMFEQEEPDSEEPMPEAPDSSTHPDKNRHRKEVPCICIFDSLNGPNRSRVVTMLREYLEIEWKMRKGTRKIFDKTTMQGHIIQCPQQTNYSDCGVYVLQYVESFFENPIPYFDSTPNLTNWFPKDKVANKRQELMDLIAKLQKKYFPNSPAIRNINVSENVPSSQPQVLQTDNR